MARELLKDLIYGEQLVSDDCKVDFAVGLTYSLNLEAMLTVPLAFGDLGELESSVKQSPAFLLEGIRRSGDKIALFCNKGGIRVPSETRTVYSLLCLLILLSLQFQLDRCLYTIQQMCILFLLYSHLLGVFYSLYIFYLLVLCIHLHMFHHLYYMLLYNCSLSILHIYQLLLLV